MSGTFAPEQPDGAVADLRGADTEQPSAVTAPGRAARGQDSSFVVTIRTPAGHQHRFRVSGDQRVETVTNRGVAYFVAQGELAEGKYVLAVLRDGTPEDMTASARLEDYGVHEGDVLVLIVGEPQVDG
ncbi:MAG TPA: hypothetical protein VMV92_22225 [Streptosporangiaceae bacterium]|nr:hypothetical protein [Streptosporangiaceae bacterium]